MTKLSRRALARHGTDQLLAGKDVTDLAKHLVAALAESGRIGDVPLLLSDIAGELERRQVLAIGRVTSARPLTKELEIAIIAQLKKATQSQEVMLEQKLDKSVIGGLKIETSNRVWDLSVAGELEQIREIS